MLELEKLVCRGYMPTVRKYDTCRYMCALHYALTNGRSGNFFPSVFLQCSKYIMHEKFYVIRLGVDHNLKW